MVPNGLNTINYLPLVTHQCDTDCCQILHCEINHRVHRRYPSIATEEKTTKISIVFMPSLFSLKNSFSKSHLKNSEYLPIFIDSNHSSTESYRADASLVLRQYQVTAN